MKKLSTASTLFAAILLFALEVQTVSYCSRPTRLEDGSYVWGYSEPLTRLEDGTYTFKDKKIIINEDGSYIVHFSSGHITEVFPEGNDIASILKYPNGAKIVFYSKGNDIESIFILSDKRRIINYSDGRVKLDA